MKVDARETSSSRALAACGSSQRRGGTSARFARPSYPRTWRGDPDGRTLYFDCSGLGIYRFRLARRWPVAHDGGHGGRGPTVTLEGCRY